MNRTELIFRQAGDRLQWRHVGLKSDDWRNSLVSRDMKINAEEITSIGSLIDIYLYEDEKSYFSNTKEALSLGEQRKIGRALFRGLFGDAIDFPLTQWLHLVPVKSDGQSPDEFADFVSKFCQLPWTFLNDGSDEKSGFLALYPVVVTLDVGARHQHGNYEVVLPTVPRLLMVLPEVKHDDRTQDTFAKKHGKEVRIALADVYESEPQNIRCVRTFEEMARCLTRSGLDADTFDPHIIYFYGHGHADSGTKFEFEDGKGASDWHSMDEVAELIQATVTRTQSPPLVWLNCCRGAAARFESGFHQVSKVASCVIAMRTVVRREASRALALEGLQLIIAGGFDPVSAMKNTLLFRLATQMGSGHWASTVISAQFTQWTASGREEVERREGYALGDFPGLVDRKQPLDKIRDRVNTEIRARANKPMIVAWTGAKEQAPDRLEGRLRILLEEDFSTYRPILRRLELQQAIRAAGDEVEGQLWDSIHLSLRSGSLRLTEPRTAAAVAERVRAVAPGSSAVLAIQHGPIPMAAVPLVERYVRIWALVCEQLGQKGARIILALPFEEWVPPLVAPDGVRPIDSPEEIKPLRLMPASSAEVNLHLYQYRGYYNVDPQEIAKVTAGIDGEARGQFTRLIGLLEDRVFPKKEPRVAMGEKIWPD